MTCSNMHSCIQTDCSHTLKTTFHTDRFYVGSGGNMILFNTSVALINPFQRQDISLNKYIVDGWQRGDVCCELAGSGSYS